MKPILLIIILFLNTFSLIAEPNEDFIFSASQNNLEGMQEALAKGADINAVDELDCNALMFAAMYGYTDIVKFLLANQIKPDTVDIASNTALLYAAQNGYVEIVEFLILAGADVNKQDDYDRTALHHAANYGYLDMAKLLIRSGAKLDVKNKNDNTPLDLAEMNMEIEIIKFLKSEIDNRKYIN
ncbi:MAG: ankyrin repeat domain-containing protein [Leptospiraceae bacterium]|nr:ankyrin repeat domain-containing protein [Leptospiraceae bacterium]